VIGVSSSVSTTVTSMITAEILFIFVPRETWIRRYRDVCRVPVPQVATKVTVAVLARPASVSGMLLTEMTMPAELPSRSSSVPFA
jgi:hypothetical protein